VHLQHDGLLSRTPQNTADESIHGDIHLINKYQALGRNDTDDADSGISLLESISPEINVVSAPEYSDIHVVLDSGAADYVVDNAETPGYHVRESIGSRLGAAFVAANGERIPNRGEVELDLKAGGAKIKWIFQVSQISQPLWSVGKLCDAGYSVTFERDHADIKQASTGKKVGKFERKHGLYVGTFQLRNPNFKEDTIRKERPICAPALKAAGASALKKGATTFQRPT